MIEGLRPYPAYKDSSSEWLGRIPQPWSNAAVRRFCRVFAGATPSRLVPEYWEPGTIPWLASGDVNQRRISSARQFITQGGFEASSTKWIRPGSVVLALAGQGRTKGMVATVEIPATCNQSLAVLEPRTSIANYQFLAYYLESRYTDIRALVGNDLRDGLNLEHVKSLSVPLPPLDEQAAIVRFLDHADRRIRRYIRAKQRLIALLEEQKQAIIHRAVTRGLDPDVRLMPSGVEWLGDIPEHWEVRRVKAEFECLNHRRIPLSSTERGQMSARVHDYYGASGVIDRVDDYIFDDELLLIAEDGANLINRNLPLAIVARGKFWVNNHAHILKPKRGNLEYLAHAMERLDYQAWITGAAQPKLTKDRLMSIAMSVPSRVEQDRIVEWIAQETHALVSGIERARREIGLLRELRARLIADVVTGVIDIREAAAQLPEETGEAVLLDDLELPDDDLDDLSVEETQAELEEALT